MLKRPKSKGRLGEWEWAEFLSERLGIKHTRMPLSGAVKGFQGDIFSPPQIPIIWEVKRTETFHPLSAYRQAREAIPIGSGKIAAVAWRKNNSDWCVFLTGNDFINILYAAIKGGWK